MTDGMGREQSTVSGLFGPPRDSGRLLTRVRILVQLWWTARARARARCHGTSRWLNIIRCVSLWHLRLDSLRCVDVNHCLMKVLPVWFRGNWSHGLVRR